MASLKNATTFSGLGYLALGRPIFIVRTLFALKPTSTLRRRTTVLISSPAQTSNTSVNATSVTTSAPRKRFRRVEPPELRPSFNQPAKSGVEICNAGTRPKTTPVRSDAESVNRTVRVSIEMLSKTGLICEATEPIALVPQTARSNPTPPPSTARIKLSVRSCCMSRRRPAPIAARIVISLYLAVARANNRLATFAHATSRTKTTAPKMSHNVRFSPPTVSSVIEITVAL